MIVLRTGAKRGLVERLDDIEYVQSIFPGYGFDGAIIARTAEVQLFEYRNGFWVTLFDISDDCVAADQLVESEH
jgi:hypothetical protein